MSPFICRADAGRFDNRAVSRAYSVTPVSRAEAMRKPGSIIAGACAAIIAVAVMADTGALRAQGEVPAQQYTITEAQLKTYAQHGTSREVIHAALGRPLLKECGEDFEVWTYRVDNHRVGLLFQDGLLALTIVGNIALEGERHPC
jgi:hypothetical protein